MRSFAKVQSDDRIVSQLQDNIGKVVEALALVPMNSGILLEDIDLVVGSNVIYTTLPTILRGWFLTRVNDAAVIYDEQDTNTNAKTLILNSDAIVTVSVFVF